MAGRRTSLAVELFEQFQAADAGHAHVQQQAARPRGIEARRELLGRFVGLGPQVHRPHQHRQGLPHGRIVVDDENGRFSFPRLCSPWSIGKVKWKVLPRSALGVTHSLPPWFSMIDWLMGKPMPMPSGLVVKNRSKTRSIVGRRNAGAAVAHVDHDVLPAVARRADGQPAELVRAIRAWPRNRCASG